MRCSLSVEQLMNGLLTTQRRRLPAFTIGLNKDIICKRSFDGNASPSLGTMAKELTTITPWNIIIRTRMSTLEGQIQIPGPEHSIISQQHNHHSKPTTPSPTPTINPTCKTSFIFSAWPPVLPHSHCPSKSVPTRALPALYALTADRIVSFRVKPTNTSAVR
jgi:hypothetical protein